jgi:ADP-ribosylation factor-like protein 1
VRLCPCVWPTARTTSHHQDLPGAHSAAQISDALALAQLKDRRWQICKAVATQGEGLQEGLDWIVQALTNK